MALFKTDTCYFYTKPRGGAARRHFGTVSSQEHRIPKMPGQTSRMSFPHENTKKRSYRHI